ncbi:anaphase-promoting complex, subunit 10-domain-containing protein [Lipomyces doorenjongii]|uniref:anaphase-promoting complex, subunit 10-domain-containing protein n=1 Tax=Lipomyces doorenjongii TaxID=383834 RepID=UPI0034CD7F31
MDSEMLTSSEVEEQIPSDAVVEEGQEDDEVQSSGGEQTDGTTAHVSEQPAIPLRDIGNQATWKLSTWKPGFGVHALISESTDLYWQSDAPQPHHIDIHFAKRVEIAKIMMYLDYRRDESYTPSKIAVYAGSGYHDLHEVLSLGLEEPVGWIDISLAHAGKDGFLKAFLVRLSVLQNHQTGKDTHIRGIKILSPDRQANDIDDDGLPFNSVAFLAHSTIR